MLEQRVATFIRNHALIDSHTEVLVGVSGGVDSIVLINVLHALGYALTVAHVNYGLRDAASDKDEALVKAQCERLGVRCRTTAVDTKAYMEAHGVSLQEAARDIRYAFFARTAEAASIRYVAVGHHLDDQAETVLLHLVRGAGPEGMAGMPVKRALEPGSEVLLVRPLLGVQREEITSYARANSLSWREDASNQSLKYQRNVVRTLILPLIEQHFGEAASVNIARSGALLREYVDTTLRRDLEAIFTRVSMPETMKIDLDGIRALEPVWRRRVILEGLKRWLPGIARTAVRSEVISDLIEAQPGRRVVFQGGSVWRGRDGLLFVSEEKQRVTPERDVLLYPGETVETGKGMMVTEEGVAPPASTFTADTPDAIVVDAERLTVPLVLRAWKPGDRLQPLGMQGTKKVSDLLTDVKVPTHRRAAVLVLTSGEEIVWVVGVRMADPFRVRPETKRFLKITYLPHTQSFLA